MLDLLSPRGRRPIAAAALVEACALFGIGSNRARVTLARLAAEGRLEHAGRGAYALSRCAEAINRRVRAWTELDRTMRPWNGDWIVVHLERRPGARERAATSHALRFARMALATPTIAVRPDNLRLSDIELRDTLVEMGLRAPFFIVRGEAEAAARSRFAALWPVGELRAEQAKMAARLEKSIARIAGLPFERALTETFTLGGDGIRTLIMDPLLPETMMPPHERARLLATMRDYDRVGRKLWRRFMARFDSAGHTDSAPFETAEFAAPAQVQ